MQTRVAEAEAILSAARAYAPMPSGQPGRSCALAHHPSREIAQNWLAITHGMHEAFAVTACSRRWHQRDYRGGGLERYFDVMYSGCRWPAHPLRIRWQSSLAASADVGWWRPVMPARYR